MTAQILIWERTTRLEAGLKRELFQHDLSPEVRPCRSAKQVLEKREASVDAVLVLDEPAFVRWIEDCDENAVQAIRLNRWRAVIAVTPSVDEPDWTWTATGVTSVLAGPVHDGRLAKACVAALSS